MSVGSRQRSALLSVRNLGLCLRSFRAEFVVGNASSRSDSEIPINTLAIRLIGCTPVGRRAIRGPRTGGQTRSRRLPLPADDLSPVSSDVKFDPILDAPESFARSREPNSKPG